MVVLSLMWLGEPLVELNGNPIRFETRKALALLALLSANPRGVSRDRLAALFWANQSQELARTNLRRCLWSLRQRLGSDWFETERENISLRIGDGLVVDAQILHDAVREVENHGHEKQPVCPECLTVLERAANECRGDFLEGFNLPDCPEFDEWQTTQRETLRRDAGRTFGWLAHLYRSAKDWEKAIVFSRRRVALDPLNEPAQRALIETYAQAGQRNLAKQQYQALIHLLNVELQQPPEPATEDLFKSLIKANPDRHFKPYSPSLFRGNIPAPVLNFIGRQKELGEVMKYFADRTCRLVTITGPGGIGKTHLAMEAARQVQAILDTTAYLVSLVGVQSSEHLFLMILESMGHAPAPGMSQKETLLFCLRSQPTLLVLDNFEHLVSGAPLLIDLLEQVPQLKILVTSRRILNLSGEWIIQLGGMNCPNPIGEDQEASEAVQLFVESARRARANFRFSKSEKNAVARICWLVMGMPLGLVLAGAWVRSLNCAEIATELERNLDFLTSSFYDLPDRHRSLRTVLEQTFQSLKNEEQKAFLRLAIFPGDFDRQAAQAVGVPLELLASLIDQAFLQRHYVSRGAEPGTESEGNRYLLHDLLRQFAREKLQTDPAGYWIASHMHATYYLRFVQQRTAGLKGSHPKETLSDLITELDNIRVGWNWAIQQGDLELVHLAAEGLFFLYEYVSTAEGETTFARACDVFAQQLPTYAETDPQRSQSIAWLFLFYARHAQHDFHMDQYEMYFDRALAIFRYWAAQLDHPEAQYAAALANVICNGLHNRFLACEELFKWKETLVDSLEVLREWRDDWASGYCSMILGYNCRVLGQIDQGRRYLLGGLAIAQSTAIPFLISESLNHLGGLEEWVGNFEAARRYYERYYQVGITYNGPSLKAHSLAMIGDMHRVLGDLDTAALCLDEANDLCQKLWNPLVTSIVMRRQALLAFDREDFCLAQEIQEENLAARRTIGAPYLICQTLTELAETRLALQDMISAPLLLEESLELAKKAHYEYGRAATWIALGKANLAKGDKEAAMQCFSHAQEIAFNIGTTPLALSSELGKIAAGYYTVGNREDTGARLQELLANPALFPKDRKWAAGLMPFL